MDYRTAKKYKPGMYIMPKTATHLTDNYKIIETHDNLIKHQITFILSNKTAYNHKEVKEPCK